MMDKGRRQFLKKVGLTLVVVPALPAIVSCGDLLLESSNTTLSDYLKDNNLFEITDANYKNEGGLWVTEDVVVAYNGIEYPLAYKQRYITIFINGNYLPVAINKVEMAGITDVSIVVTEFNTAEILYRETVKQAR